MNAPLIALVCTGLLSALLFLLLGHAVRHQTTRAFDHSTLRSIHLSTASFPVAIVTAVSLLGSDVVITAIGTAWCIAFALRRRWLDTLFMASAVGGYIVLAVIAKNTLQQERPVDVFQIPDAQYRFPSGHTLGATCLAIALGYFLWRGRHGYGVKALGAVGLVSGILGVGGSRLVLNLHYPTDVAGGMLLGIAWMSMLIVARQALGRWRAHDQKGAFALSGIEERRL